MTTYVFHEVLNQAQKLTPDEQLRLVEELVAFMRQKGQRQVQRKHDITELRGLGKEIWEGIDVAQYINEERDSWDR
jgi:hypothetical protein